MTILGGTGEQGPVACKADLARSRRCLPQSRSEVQHGVAPLQGALGSL